MMLLPCVQSVTIPTKPFLQVILSVISIWEVLLVIVAFILPFVFLQTSVVRRIKHLSEVMSAISVGRKVEFNKGEITPDSSNELHQLAVCADRLSISITMAENALRAQRKNS